jgi:ABC-type proline/glycine betaine transport system substrate-binding protein
MKKLIALLVCVLFAMTIMVAACAKKEEPAKPAEPAKKEESVKPAEPEKKAEEAKTEEKAPEPAPEKK